MGKEESSNYTLPACKRVEYVKMKNPRWNTKNYCMTIRRVRRKKNLMPFVRFRQQLDAAAKPKKTQKPPGVKKRLASIDSSMEVGRQQQQVIWKGKHKKFDDDDDVSGRATKYSGEDKDGGIKWDNAKYLSTVTGKGTPVSWMRERRYHSLTPSFVSPILALSRNRCKYEAHNELAVYAIKNYNSHHEQTKFEVVDIMAVNQMVRPNAIYIYLTFTAKDTRADKYPLRKFTTKIEVCRPSNLTEVVSCTLEESTY